MTDSQCRPISYRSEDAYIITTAIGEGNQETKADILSRGRGGVAPVVTHIQCPATRFEFHIKRKYNVSSMKIQ